MHTQHLLCILYTVKTQKGIVYYFDTRDQSTKRHHVTKLRDPLY